MVKEVVEEFFQERKKIIILVGFLISLFLFGTISFAIIKNISITDSFIMTVEALALQHKEEFGAGKTVQTLLLLFGVFLLWFSLWTILDVVMEGHFHKYFKEVITMEKVKRLKNHYIICGGGRVGEYTAKLLKEKKLPFVIVERDIHMVSLLRKRDDLVLQGDALQEETLKEAGIERAKGVMAVLPETEKNVLLILTAKELNQNAKVYVRSQREEYVKKLKKAGADYVIQPHVLGGRHLAHLIKTNSL